MPVPALETYLARLICLGESTLKDLNAQQLNAAQAAGGGERSKICNSGRIRRQIHLPCSGQTRRGHVSDISTRLPPAWPGAGSRPQAMAAKGPAASQTSVRGPAS